MGSNSSKTESPGHTILEKINAISDHGTTKALGINDFTIVKFIGGAFGNVFLAQKKNNKEPMYAIKVMKKSEIRNKNMVSEVVTERNALALLRSPFCVHLYYSFQSVSSVYLVMEYMTGGDLQSLLRVYGFLEESAAVFYIAGVILALEHLHKQNIIHRDLKPDHILISKSGHVKLTDFGLSRIETYRDLEVSDFVNSTPTLSTRTLTSHFMVNSEGDRDTTYHPTFVVEPCENLLEELTQTCKPSKSIGSGMLDRSQQPVIHLFMNIDSTNLNDAIIKDSSSESSILFHTCESLETASSRDNKSTDLSSNTSSMQSILSADSQHYQLASPVLGGQFLKRKPRSVNQNYRHNCNAGFLSSTLDDQQMSGAKEKATGEGRLSPIECEAPRATAQSPYRSPKSVRRGNQACDQRIVGTPDYLAPEILLKQDHGPQVDWWAAGVCLYEFMIGVPPFNDETPQAVVHNVLSKNIEWPEGDEALTEEAVSAIEALLTLDPSNRPEAFAIKGMPLFKAVDWDNQLNAKPPFVPSPDNLDDTGYF